MALSTESNLLIGASLAGAFLIGNAQNKVNYDVNTPNLSGILSLGKFGNAIVGAGSQLFSFVKDNLGKIKIGNPLKGIDGQDLYLGVKKVASGVGTGVKYVGNVVGKGLSGVYNLLTDGSNPIEPSVKGVGTTDSGHLNLRGGIQQADIDRVVKSLAPIAENTFNRAENIAGEEVFQNIDVPVEISSRLPDTTKTSTTPIDTNKILLYVGGGIVALILVFYLGRRGGR